MDLCRGQRHHRTVTNAVEGNLLNMGRDALETSGDGGTPSIDGIHGCVRRQLERLQLAVRADNHRNKKTIKIKIIEIGMRCS